MAHASISLRGKARFGPFQANLRTAELRKYDLPVKLAGRPFEILAMLLEAQGEIVTREEIRARLWPPDTFVDFENNINTAIGKLRSALGDSAAAPRYVETAGRGYRFLVQVEWLETEPPSSSGIPAFAPIASVPPPIQTRSHWRWIFASAIVALLVVGTVAWYLRPSRPVAPVSGKTMIAVLPFQNLTGDETQDYLSDGLTEEIIAQIGGLQSPNLGVIANTSVLHYKRSHASLDQIGRELGVQYVMEGGVRRDGDRVRVTADLIEMQHKTQVWARQYDRERTGLLAMQSEIAQQIAYEVHSTFGGVGNGNQAIQSQNDPSHESYLRGRYFFNQRTSTSLVQAIGYFEQAIQQDSSNARAYAELADCYTLLQGYAGTTHVETLVKAHELAMQAVKLDPALPEAHAALALTAENAEWDWVTAEQEFRRAIELNPSYATAHHWYAEHLAFRGRFEEALRESEIARRLDPLSLIIAADDGAIFYFARRYDDAIERWRSVLSMDPNFSRAQIIIAAYVEQGRYNEALKFLENQNQNFSDIWYVSTHAYIEGRSGDRAGARRDLDRLLKMYAAQPFDPRIIAKGYIGLGDKEHALTFLEKACDQHSIELTSLYVNPEFDPLRAEPRFQKLLARVHLP